MSVFDRFLSTPEAIAAFDAGAIVQAMLDFERALAVAEAAEGLIPQTAAASIGACCDAARFDVETIVSAAPAAGSLAIPLVKALTRAVGERDAAAAAFVHHGSTSQDAIDTAMVLATQRLLRAIRADLDHLIDALFALAARHRDTPMLGRTLLQPAQVISFATELLGWVAPLVRTRARLESAAVGALQLQLGGAVGTLERLDGKGDAVARRLAGLLGIGVPPGPWHAQRDAWVALGCEIGVLCGALGKIANDLALLSQAEIGEVAEPSGMGRGGSSAMPHKRNPVAAMVALAAAARAPQRVAALLATMPQQHQRGLGNWQAELAEWPGLLACAHGSVRALSTALPGLEVDGARMLANIDALQGLVFSEGVAVLLGPHLGKAESHARIAVWSRQALESGRGLREIAEGAIAADAALAGRIDRQALDAVFDVGAAARRAGRHAQVQLDGLRKAFPAIPRPTSTTTAAATPAP